MASHFRQNKTVYVLGAGFSMDAGAPSQAALLSKMLAIPSTEATVADAQSELTRFLVDVLNIPPGDVSRVTLEDVFTPIDRCLADGVALRGRSPAYLQTLRVHIEFLISLTISVCFDSKPDRDKQYADDFAKYLVKEAAKRASKAKHAKNADGAKNYDPFAIISLNWDILLDHFLYKNLGEEDKWEEGDYEPIGVVDYCCYISSVNANEKRIRSGLWTLGARGYNVKLLKIHGSMNWLQCTNCQRLFVSFDKKLYIPNHASPSLCRHCLRHGINAYLEGALIMPTFLKDLTNFQIKLVWQNAAVELMEATKVIFLGYSLPQADFEFRQLLARTVHKDASIEVVLRKRNSPESQRTYEDTCGRYRQFFGARSLKFRPGGVSRFVRELISSPIT